MSTPFRALVLAVASCVLLPACACTFVGGNDGLFVDVEVTGGTLPGGVYTYIARVGGVEARMQSMLDPSGSAVTGLGGQGAVVDGKTLYVGGTVFSTWGTIEVGFREGGGPETVTLEVLRDGAMIAQATYTPRYQEVHPNGDHCPPSLEQARESLEIVAPVSGVSEPPGE